MTLFDSHAHLCDRQYEKDLPEVLDRAARAGVKWILDVGYDRATILRSREIAEQSPRVYSAFGFHPHDAKTVNDEDYHWLEEQLGHPKCRALGEIGLDTFKNYSPLDDQIRVLEKQLDLARTVNKPVIFHSRGAEAKVLEIARDKGITNAVFHCYTGDEQTALAIVAAGFSLSFTGTITYGKTPPTWISGLPLDRVMVETDCPYLSPVPLRGKRNEPAHLVHTLAALAKLMGVKEEILATATSENAAAFFSIA